MKHKQYNLMTLIEDSRGLEMLQLIANATHDRVLYAYDEIVKYVNLNGLDETYSQYLAIKDKINFNSQQNKAEDNCGTRKLRLEPWESSAYPHSADIYIYEGGINDNTW